MPGWLWFWAGLDLLFGELAFCWDGFRLGQFCAGLALGQFGFLLGWLCTGLLWAGSALSWVGFGAVWFWVEFAFC